MANPQSNQPIQVGGGDQLAQLAKLLPVLFGSKQTGTSNPGDVSSLQQLIAQLQGTDYNGTLQTIFQQAGGQIPGLQAAFSNAVGARSGNNSAVQAALSKLMMETTLAGQKQVADQQLNNQQIQASAGNSIAQATKDTTQSKKEGGIAGQLAGVLGLVQAAKMATGSRDLEELGRKLGFGGSAGRDAGAAPVSGPTAGAPIGGAAAVTGAPMMSTGPGFDLSAVLGANAPVMTGMGGAVADPTDFSLPDDLFIGGMSTAPGASGFNFNEILGGGGMSTPVMGNGGGFNMDWFGDDFGGGGFDAGYIDPMNFY